MINMMAQNTVDQYPHSIRINAIKLTAQNTVDQ